MSSVLDAPNAQESLRGEFGGRHVVTVPEAGRLLNLGRTASYMAAQSGELPTLRIRGKLVVPIMQLEALLAGKWKPEVDNA